MVAANAGEPAKTTRKRGRTALTPTEPFPAQRFERLLRAGTKSHDHLAAQLMCALANSLTLQLGETIDEQLPSQVIDFMLNADRQ